MAGGVSICCKQVQSSTTTILYNLMAFLPQNVSIDCVMVSSHS